MTRIREVIVVEGRYDKNALSQVVDAVIVETSGFGIYNDAAKRRLLRTLAGKPEEEVRAGINLLRALGLRRGVQFISCPTCGRTEYDLIGTAKEVESRLRDKPWDITVAVMGCIVNGPGEASHADYGIAGGKSEGVLFRHGRPLRRVSADSLADALVELIESENDS